MKRVLCAALALVLVLLAGIPALAEENLIENGGFEQLDGGQPAIWQREMWLTDTGVSLLDVEEDGYEGRCVSVANVDENDARYAQTVAVEPDTLYRISAMVKAEGCDPAGNGATISIGDTFVYSESLYDTKGRWEYVELYGWTDSDQTELTVFCRVGGYGMLTRGRAWFDDVQMTAVDDVPEGVLAEDFFRDDSGFSGGASTPADDGEPERFTEAWLLFTFVDVLAAAAAVRKRGRSPWPAGRSSLRLGILLAAALLLRMIVAARVLGYNTDINCFTGWSERIFSVGLTRFYSPDYFCDYPPGYMLLLWPVALIRRALGLATGTAGYRVVLKLLPMLADAAGAWLIWRASRDRLSERAALLLAGFYALNPAAIANSAAWGQIDALLTLLIALCALSAVEYRYVRALLWFAAALLVKPQALLFAPLGLAAMLAGILRAEDAEARAHRLRQFLIGVACCLGVLYGAAFLFCVRQATGVGDALVRPVTWMVNLYSGTMQGYRYMTVNTLNLHCLLGLNWARVENHPAVFAVAWVLFGLAYLYAIALCALDHKSPTACCCWAGPSSC